MTKQEKFMSLDYFQQNKKKLCILILGPYRPNAALRSLERLKECLIRRGFQMTKLAKDFSDDVKYSEDLDEHFTIKSQMLIKNWAHVPIFVFLKGGDNLGVNTELKYTCDLLPDKSSHSCVFFEAKMDTSSLVRGSVKIAKISYETFKGHVELCNLTFGHCVKMLDRLFYYI